MRLRSGSRSDEAFAITPDPRFAFDSSSFLSAFLALVGGIERRDGLMVLVGDSGCGKTMLLRAVQDTFVRRRGLAFFRFQPYATLEDLLESLLIELQINPMPPSRDERLEALGAEIERRLSPAVLLVDEAHCFVDGALHDFAELAAWRAGTPSSLQVILTGRPALEERLRQPELAKLAARVSMTAHLGPLTRDELPRYVAHRLAVAQRGVKLAPLAPDPFAPSAWDPLFQYSRGTPRIVNRLCGRALAGDPARIGPSRIDEAAVECGLALPSALPAGLAAAPGARRHADAVMPAPPPRRRAYRRVGAAVVLAAASVGLGAVYLVRTEPRRGAVDEPQSLASVQFAWADIMGAEAGQVRAPERVAPDEAAESEAPQPAFGAEPAAAAEPDAPAPPTAADTPSPETAATESDGDVSQPVESLDSPEPGSGDASAAPSAEPRADITPSEPIDTGDQSIAPEPETQPVDAATDAPPQSEVAPEPSPATEVEIDTSALPLEAPPPPEAAAVTMPHEPPPIDVAAEAATPARAVTPAPAPTPPSPPALDSEKLVARGQALLQSGDPASARLFFERAANQGHAGAMAAMGRTFDPIELNRLGIVGIAGDPGLALDWYRRAAQAGDQPSRERMARLTEWIGRQQGRR